MIVPILLGVSILFYSYSSGHNMDTIRINGESFRTQMRDDTHISKKVADDLYIIKHRVDRLISHLKNKHHADKNMKEACDRLLNKYKGNIQEIPSAKNDRVAYNENKGDAIALCMYKDGQHQDINTAMFVTLHELAHCMTKEYRHNEKFWNNFRFLIKESIHLGIYYYQDFANNSENYCGMKISSTPYKI